MAESGQDVLPVNSDYGRKGATQLDRKLTGLNLVSVTGVRLQGRCQKC